MFSSTFLSLPYLHLNIHVYIHALISQIDQYYYCYDYPLLCIYVYIYIYIQVIVFFSTCNAVKFYGELLNYIDVPVLDLHGQQKQAKRTATFFEFCNAQRGILLCTDVAARGLDIPSVDWIIQYDPPNDPKEYIHRVGRTARGINAKGRALLFLMPEELRFLKHLKAARVPLNEFEFPLDKIARVQSQLEELVSKNYFLHKSAREAYKSYVQGYAQHPLKDAFNASQLDLLAVAKSFGFTSPPSVSIQMPLKARKVENTYHRNFNEDDPYGNGKQGGGDGGDDDNDDNGNSHHKGGNWKSNGQNGGNRGFGKGRFNKHKGKGNGGGKQWNR